MTQKKRQLSHFLNFYVFLTVELPLCKVDKRRSNYYQYYTDRVWGKAENYDLCINTGKFDTDAIIGMIVDAYRRS